MPDYVDQIADEVRIAQQPGARLRVGKVTEVLGGKARLDITGLVWLATTTKVTVGNRCVAMIDGYIGVIVGVVDSGDPTPVGAVTAYAGTDTALPGGWVLCDGRAVSRTDFPVLYARLGTSYGAGDGATTFNLPNLVGRFPLGVSATRPRGTTGGAERVTLSAGQMPGHEHGSAGGHTHTLANGANDVQVASGTGAFVAGLNDQTTSSSGAHTHAVRGNNESHENMPPFQVLHYLIKVV